MKYTFRNICQIETCVPKSASNDTSMCHQFNSNVSVSSNVSAFFEIVSNFGVFPGISCDTKCYLIAGHAHFLMASRI